MIHGHLSYTQFSTTLADMTRARIAFTTACPQRPRCSVALPSASTPACRDAWARCPIPPRSDNPNARHVWFEIAMKQLPRKPASAVQSAAAAQPC